MCEVHLSPPPPPRSCVCVLALFSPSPSSPPFPVPLLHCLASSKADTKQQNTQTMSDRVADFKNKGKARQQHRKRRELTVSLRKEKRLQKAMKQRDMEQFEQEVQQFEQTDVGQAIMQLAPTIMDDSQPAEQFDAVVQLRKHLANNKTLPIQATIKYVASLIVRVCCVPLVRECVFCTAMRLTHSPSPSLLPFVGFTFISFSALVSSRRWLSCWLGIMRQTHNTKLPGC